MPDDAKRALLLATVTSMSPLYRAPLAPKALAVLKCAYFIRGSMSFQLILSFFSVGSGVDKKNKRRQRSATPSGGEDTAPGKRVQRSSAETRFVVCFLVTFDVANTVGSRSPSPTYDKRRTRRRGRSDSPFYSDNPKPSKRAKPR